LWHESQKKLSVGRSQHSKCDDVIKIVNDKAIHILFADDTSIVVKGYNLKNFQNNMINAFNCVFKWFRINLLSLNVNKTHCMQFVTKTNPKMI
jgi:hypothetical protein